MSHQEQEDKIFCRFLHEFVDDGIVGQIIGEKKGELIVLIHGEVIPEGDLDCGDCPLGGDPCDPSLADFKEELLVKKNEEIILTILELEHAFEYADPESNRLHVCEDELKRRGLTKPMINRLAGNILREIWS